MLLYLHPELMMQRVDAAQARQNNAGPKDSMQNPGGSNGPTNQGYVENVSYGNSADTDKKGKASKDLTRGDSRGKSSQKGNNPAESQNALIFWPRMPHKNRTKGHWETIQRTAKILASGQKYAVLFVNNGFSRAVPGARPNRRPDILAIRRDGKVDQFEIPSKTDNVLKLRARMEENKQILGSLAGNT